MDARAGESETTRTFGDLSQLGVAHRDVSAPRARDLHAHARTFSQTPKQKGVEKIPLFASSEFQFSSHYLLCDPFALFHFFFQKFAEVQAGAFLARKALPEMTPK